jgi:hypothetical protein
LKTEQSVAVDYPAPAAKAASIALVALFFCASGMTRSVILTLSTGERKRTGK